MEVEGVSVAEDEERGRRETGVRQSSLTEGNSWSLMAVRVRARKPKPARKVEMFYAENRLSIQMEEKQEEEENAPFRIA
jgi:hypothetical protein